jgi:hypothetical protein
MIDPDRPSDDTPYHSEKSYGAALLYVKRGLGQMKRSRRLNGVG